MESGKFDIIVAGGGVSGVAAAVSAARQGARVALLERYGFLGGLASSADVGTICGLYLRGSLRYGVGKFPQEFAACFNESEPVIMNDGLAFLPVSAAQIDMVSAKLLKESNVRIFPHSTVIDVIKKEREILSLKVFCHDQHCSISGSHYIDASGSAIITRLAGGKFREISEDQVASLTVSLSGVKGAVSAREISLVALRGGYKVSMLPVLYPDGNIKLKFSMGITPKNGVEVAESEASLRASLADMLQLLQAEVAALANIRISQLTAQLGTRANPLPEAIEMLTLQDVIGGRMREDGVANGCWPVERWLSNGRLDLQYLNAEKYQVAAGSLESASFSNLFFAGRAIGADEFAIASARVIGTALGTGYAAGALAAAKLKGRARSSMISEIQDELAI